MPRLILTNEFKLTHPRNRSSKRIFIAVEGFRTEKKYLKALGDEIKTNIEIILISRQLQHSGLSAPQYVLQTIKQKKESTEYRIGDEFWIIIDRDSWITDEIIRKCEEENIGIIINNPCFEIWILFHYLNRNQINTIKEFENCKSVEDAIKVHDSHFSKSRPVIKRTFRGLNTAVWISKELDISPRNSFPNNPGSRMYRLIDVSLISQS